MLRMDQQLGRPVLIEFWDFCRPNSIRTLPYIKAWHERYEPHGLQVIGIHSPGFDPSRDPDAVAEACRRLGISYPVAIDTKHQVWESYGNMGWPARYLFDRRGMLFEHHYGEGAYEETELAIQELLDIHLPPIDPLRPEDVPGATLEPQSADVEGPYSGPYRAGAVWAVLSGVGTVVAGGRPLRVEHPGCYELIRHEHSTEGVLELELGTGVHCHAVCFTPGAKPGSPED
jgi:hypothetical protein